MLSLKPGAYFSIVSKTILAYTLNNKKLPNENIENTFDESDLLVDIFSYLIRLLKKIFGMILLDKYD